MIKRHVHMSMLPQLQSQPRFFPARFKESRGRKGGSYTHTDIISHFSELHDWSTQHSTDHALTTEQKGLGTLQLPKISLSASIGLMVHPFCCGRAIASQPLVVSRSSTVKCVFRKKLFSTSPKQLYETDTSSWPGVSGAGPTKMSGKPSQESVLPNPQSCLKKYLDYV